MKKSKFLLTVILLLPMTVFASKPNKAPTGKTLLSNCYIVLRMQDDSDGDSTQHNSLANQLYGRCLGYLNGVIELQSLIAPNTMCISEKLLELTLAKRVIQQLENKPVLLKQSRAKAAQTALLNIFPCNI